MMFKFFVCFVIEILHHTTTDTAWPCIRLSLYLIGSLHQTTTHPRHECRVVQLYLIEILHQTTTRTNRWTPAERLYLIEILHQTTTTIVPMLSTVTLYLIEILHQTTTVAEKSFTEFSLYLIEILHQTTTPGVLFVRFQCFMPFCPAGKLNAEPSSKCVWCAFLYFKEQRYRFFRKIPTAAACPVLPVRSCPRSWECLHTVCLSQTEYS